MSTTADSYSVLQFIKQEIEDGYLPESKDKEKNTAQFHSQIRTQKKSTPMFTFANDFYSLIKQENCNIDENEDLFRELVQNDPAKDYVVNAGRHNLFDLEKSDFYENEFNLTPVDIVEEKSNNHNTKKPPDIKITNIKEESRLNNINKIIIDTTIKVELVENGCNTVSNRNERYNKESSIHKSPAFLRDCNMNDNLNSQTNSNDMVVNQQSLNNRNNLLKSCNSLKKESTIDLNFFTGENQKKSKANFTNIKIDKTNYVEFCTNSDIIKEEIPIISEKNIHDHTSSSVKNEIIFKNNILPEKSSQYECEICGYKCKYNVIFQNHMLSHVDTKSDLKDFACPICNMRCKNEGALYTHKRSHKGTKLFKCSVCKYKNASQKEFNQHIIETGHTAFECSECKEKFVNVQELNKHIIPHSSYDKMFSCPICEYRATNFCSLKKHMVKHPREKLLLCSHCEYVSNDASKLETHMLKHKDAFSCPLCDYKCSRKVDLKAHIMTHTRQKSYACSQCEYKCKGRKEILSHMADHKGSKVLQCNECDYSCSKLSVLTRHLHAHAHEKSFTCPHCEYRCVKKRRLTIHLMSHTGEKPFACEFCQYRCTQRYDLKKHERIHTKKKPFACNECDYKTANRSNLKTHMYTHTGEKPYECIKCDYRCTHHRSLEKHMIIHSVV
ncbi:unnamed protein product, partial [Meganyctiphanes norvegica]